MSLVSLHGCVQLPVFIKVQWSSFLIEHQPYVVLESKNTTISEIDNVGVQTVNKVRSKEEQLLRGMTAYLREWSRDLGGLSFNPESATYKLHDLE